MTNLKKKLLAGILSGAMIFTGGFAVNSAQAQPPADEQQEIDGRGERPEFGGRRHERPQMTEEQRTERIKEIAERLGVDQAEIEEAFKNHVRFEDIRSAAVLAKISGKSFSEVLAMKTDWQQVAEKLGVTREQVEEYARNERLEELAKHSKLDTKTVDSLLKEKYDPRDITVAGIIANASGKNIKSVLAKRKINNSWEDVAKEFNVDLKEIMKPKHERRQ